MMFAMTRSAKRAHDHRPHTKNGGQLAGWFFIMVALTHMIPNEDGQEVPNLSQEGDLYPLALGKIQGCGAGY